MAKLPPSPIHVRRGYLVDQKSSKRVEYFEIILYHWSPQSVIFYRQIDENDKVIDKIWNKIEHWDERKIVTFKKEISISQKLMKEKDIRYYQRKIKEAKKKIKELS